MKDEPSAAPLYHPKDVSIVTAYSVCQYVMDLCNHFQITFACTQMNLWTSVNGSKAYYGRKAPHCEYRIGDKIFHFRFVGNTKKFPPSWSGPLENMAKLSLVASQSQNSHQHANGSMQTRSNSTSCVDMQVERQSPHTKGGTAASCLHSRWKKTQFILHALTLMITPPFP